MLQLDMLSESKAPTATSQPTVLRYVDQERLSDHIQIIPPAEFSPEAAHHFFSLLFLLT